MKNPFTQTRKPTKRACAALLGAFAVAFAIMLQPATVPHAYAADAAGPAPLAASGAIAAQSDDGWQTDSDGTKSYYVDGKLVTGLKVIDGQTYYFNGMGDMAASRFVKVGSVLYYFGKDGVAQDVGLKQVGKKVYHYGKDGKRATGFKKIAGSKFYFNKKGVMQMGKLVKVKGKKYYLRETGEMVTLGFACRPYIAGYNGVCYKMNFKKVKSASAKAKSAKRIASQIAKAVGASGKRTDRERVYVAAWFVYEIAAMGKYAMKGSDYSTAYGAFVKGEYSCAGTTAALGLVLDKLGYKWEHVNKGKRTHQWCKLKMDGKWGYADAQPTMLGRPMVSYGKYLLA